MKESNTVRKKVGELADFLAENNNLVWANRLQQIIASPSTASSVQRLKGDIRQLFGGMGSLTDIDIYYEGDEKRTICANQHLNEILNVLYDMVK
jgi:hypothetical protein